MLLDLRMLRVRSSRIDVPMESMRGSPRSGTG